MWGRIHSNLLQIYFLMQYAKFVKPSFEEFILPSKKHADIIIPRGADNEVAIDLIVQHIRTKLGQHDLCKIYSNVYIIHSTFQVPIFALNHVLWCAHGWTLSWTGSSDSGAIYFRFAGCTRLYATSTQQNTTLFSIQTDLFAWYPVSYCNIIW